MSKQFSVFTKGLAMVLVVAVWAAIVPAVLYAEDACQDEKKAAVKASEDAGWACAVSLLTCAATAGWACLVAAAYCARKAKQAADAWGVYWACQPG